MIIKDPQFYELIKKEHPKDCFEVIEAAPVEARIRELEARNKELTEALEEIAKPSYGTEFISYDLEDYKSNYEIICGHYFGAQRMARKALGKG